MQYDGEITLVSDASVVCHISNERMSVRAVDSGVVTVNCIFCGGVIVWTNWVAPCTISST